MLAVHFLEAIVPKATTPHCGGLKAPPKVRGDVTRAVRVNKMRCLDPRVRCVELLSRWPCDCVELIYTN